MKIGFALGWMNDGTLANVVGDHVAADGLAKQMRLLGHEVVFFGPRQFVWEPVDALICFHHWCPPHPVAKSYLYMQNSFPVNEYWPGGTVGVWQENKAKYYGYIFASEGLRDACARCDAALIVTKCLVLPFATDPDVFRRVEDSRFEHPIVFVGNDLRGDSANEAWLVPALRHGLVIYGGPFKDPRLQAVNRGRASAEDLPKIFSSAKVVLNFHIPIAAEYGIVNMRVYEALACGGSIVSEWHSGMDGFSGTVLRATPLTLNDDLRDFTTARVWPATVAARREAVLAAHTWRHRTDALVKWLKEVL